MSKLSIGDIEISSITHPITHTKTWNVSTFSGYLENFPGVPSESWVVKKGMFKTKKDAQKWVKENVENLNV